MWSIHPAQIRPIVDAFTPSVAEIDQAIEILQAAQAARWAPIRHHDTLHDRASYRYFWQVLDRAHRTSVTGGPQLPAEVRAAWFGEPHEAGHLGRPGAGAEDLRRRARTAHPAHAAAQLGRRRPRTLGRR
jgi:hypothetical protein